MFNQHANPSAELLTMEDVRSHLIDVTEVARLRMADAARTAVMSQLMTTKER